MEISKLLRSGLGALLCSALIFAPIADSYAGNKKHRRNVSYGSGYNYGGTHYGGTRYGYAGYGSRYGYNQRYGYRGYGHSRHHSSHGGTSDAALVVLGAGLGYLLSEGIRGSRETRTYTNTYYVPQDRSWTGGAQQTNRQETGTYQGTDEYDQVCLETKTYEQVIYIDGEEILAEGTACLQVDGSWDLKGISLP